MSDECFMHRRLGPPPWYPYRSQEEKDAAGRKFVDSLMAGHDCSWRRREDSYD